MKFRLPADLSPSADPAALLAAVRAGQEETCDRLAGHQERLAELEKELAEQLAALEQDEGRVHQRSLQTDQQRRRLSRELRSRRAELLAEIAQQRAELERMHDDGDHKLSQQLLLATTERDRLMEELARREKACGDFSAERDAIRRQMEAQQAELQIHRTAADKFMAEAQLRLAEQERTRAEAESQAVAAKVSLEQAREDQEQLRMRLSELLRRLETCEAQRDQLQADLDQRPSGAADEATAELAAQKRETASLKEQLAAARTVAMAGDSQQAEQVHDLQKQLDSGQQEIRELKARLREQEGQLAQLRREGAAASGVKPAEPTGPLSWEDRKKQLLSLLEADDATLAASEKTQLERALSETDKAIAQKDVELEELRKLLHEQSTSIQGMAVGAAAIAFHLDGDELLRSERESLKRLQDELQEKLKGAEVQASLERAQIARERAELTELKASLEKEKQTAQANTGEDGSARKKPDRGRWLSRLGLREKGGDL